MRVGFIGGGSMGEAIVSALLAKGVAQAGDVAVSDVAEARREHMASCYGVRTTGDNAEAVAGAELAVLAVKPQEFSGVAAGLQGRLEASQTLLSIMAGVPMRRIASETAHNAVIRAMPNTPAFVGEAMSMWVAAPAVPESGREAAGAVLRAIGREVEVDDEAYLDMATALSGSGPGYVFLFLEALIEAGVQIGLAREVATELAVQTLAGSALLARGSEKPAAELRAMVTSKGGTTEAGLRVLEEAGLREAVIRAVEAAHKRSRELGG